MEENIALRQALEQFSAKKADNEEMIPGLLGVTMNGANQVECSGRNGYVWVRLHGSQTNFVQAYNGVVPPYFGLPVYVARNPFDRSKYYIVTTHDEWNNTSIADTWFYLPYYDHHGVQKFLAKSGQNATLMCDLANGKPKWSSILSFVPFRESRSHANWDGDAQVVGTTTFSVNDFNSDIPSGALAIYVYLEVIWTTASSGNYIVLRPTGASSQPICCRAYVGGYAINTSGIVPLSLNHQFNITIGGADTTYTYIGVWGYWSIG